MIEGIPESSNSNLLFRTLKPTLVVGFKFLKANGDKMGTKKYINYKPAQIHYGTPKWFVFYSYLNPQTGKFTRIKVYEDINRYKSKEYAEMLRDHVNEALERGYNPFDPLEYINKTTFIVEKNWDITQALNFFVQKWENKGNEPTTLRKYKTVIKNFIDFLKEKRMHLASAKEINEKIIELFLDNGAKEFKWSNRYCNDSMLFLRTIFKFLIKEKIIESNPAAGIQRRKVHTKHHKYFNDDEFIAIREQMKKDDPLLYAASSLIYHTAVRPEKEMKHIQLKNINIERGTILLEAEKTKTDMDRTLVIPDQLIEIFAQYKKDFPPEYYLIGAKAHNKFYPDNQPSPKPFGNSFLSNRFARVRESAKIRPHHTISNFRHTRAVHLKLAGATDAMITAIFGHADPKTTYIYLKGLGLAVNVEEIKKLNREF